ncbi:hypothetical protein Tco_0115136 [Tanacetum coccineum]
MPYWDLKNCNQISLTDGVKTYVLVTRLDDLDSSLCKLLDIQSTEPGLALIDISRYEKGIQTWIQGSALSLQMATAAQNTNNTTIRSILLAEKLTGSNFTNWYRNLRIVLRYEKKIKFVKQPIGPTPDPKTANPNTIENYYKTINIDQ